MAEVPWAELGVESSKLEYIAYRFAGVFGATHRALADCELTLHVLAQKIGELDTTPLGLLLNNSRQRTWRIRAQGAPIEVKDALKARRYKWNADMRCWWTDVPEARREEEHRWLAEECGVRMPFETPIDGRLRYSHRIPGS